MSLARIAKMLIVGIAFIAVMLAFLAASFFLSPDSIRQSQPTASETSAAFDSGAMAGFSMARLGDVKPGSAEIDAMARESATKQEVPQSLRRDYVGDWTAGYRTGWDAGR